MVKKLIKIKSKKINEIQNKIDEIDDINFIVSLRIGSDYGEIIYVAKSSSDVDKILSMDDKNRNLFFNKIQNKLEQKLGFKLSKSFISKSSIKYTFKISDVEELLFLKIFK